MIKSEWMFVVCDSKDKDLIAETIGGIFKFFNGRDLPYASVYAVYGTRKRLERLGCILVGLAEAYPICPIQVLDRDGMF